MQYIEHIAILIALYSVLAITLDLLAGYTGQFSLAHAAYWGIGAYTFGVMAMTGLPWGLCFLAAILMGAACGCVSGFPALRLGGDQFVIGTFATQAVFVDIVKNWTSVTGGPSGLSAIPNTVFGGIASGSGTFVCVTTGFALFTAWFCYRIVHAPVGRVMAAIREDTILAQSCGKDVVLTKLIVFTTAGAFAAGAGALYASYVTFIDPSTFSFGESVFIITIVIAGGAGTLFGPLMCAALLLLFQEFLRTIGLPSALLANLRGIAYGALLIFLIVLRPQGLLGSRAFDFRRK
jgi:ABC-type branched-subunit amino acid transport system permease subunit